MGLTTQSVGFARIVRRWRSLRLRDPIVLGCRQRLQPGASRAILRVVLSGRCRCALSGAEIAAGAGAALLASGPMPWTRLPERGSLDLLGIKVQDERVRVVQARLERRGERVVAGWNSGAPPSPAMESLLTSLGHLEPDADARAVAPLLSAIVELALAAVAAPAPPGGRAHGHWLELRDLIEERFTAALDRRSVARSLGMHPHHVSRLCQEQGGTTFVGLVTGMRLALARRLLEGDADLGAIASACGFADAGYFIRVFRRHHGVTPGRWRATRG